MFDGIDSDFSLTLGEDAQLSAVWPLFSLSADLRAPAGVTAPVAFSPELLSSFCAGA